MVDSDEIDRACFDDIWKLVPKGRKVAKEEARRLWDGKKNTNAGVRITAEETHLILERYPLHVEMWKRDATPTGKIPHLRTWLNQSRWVDEIEGEDVTDDGTWLYDTYRATCFADHGDDPDWECYADWAAKFEPCTAPTFNDFKKGDANG